MNQDNSVLFYCSIMTIARDKLTLIIRHVASGKTCSNPLI
jgi:hypothetical protein